MQEDEIGVDEGYTDHPGMVYSIGVFLGIGGYAANFILRGDTAQYTTLGAVVLMLSMGVLFVGLSSMTLEEQVNALLASMFASIGGLVFFVVLRGGGPLGVGQAFGNATILAAFVSAIFVIPRAISRWYYPNESPEERILGESEK